MARPEKVIADREYASRSAQWYRTIGRGRYRFRVNWKVGGRIEATADRFVSWGKWERVHHVVISEGSRFDG